MSPSAPETSSAIVLASQSNFSQISKSSSLKTELKFVSAYLLNAV
jgi:hypothetical protein